MALTDATSAKALPTGPSPVYTQARVTRGRPPATLTLLVGQIDGKLDQIIASLVPQVNDQEDRIRDLEVWRGYSKGGMAALLSLVAIMEAMRYAGVIK